MARQFCSLLRQLRLDAGMTQEELEQRSGVSGRTIRRFETDEHASPRVDTVRRLAEALRLEQQDLETLLAAAVGGETTVEPLVRQLPAAPGMFVGRGDELAALAKAVDEAAGQGGVLVISAIGGGGGVGKTWLALQWAHQNLHRYPDGQLFVDLRGFSPAGRPMEPTEAVRGFLDALGVAPAAVPTSLDAQAGLYRSLTAGKRMLVVLDNARDTEQVTPLLPASPTCTVLVTSRERLAGLVTAHGARPVALDALAPGEAWDLLARRLGRDRLAAEPEAVYEILACCGGLPLALGVVAARAALQPNIPLSALAGQLRDARLSTLDAGDPAASVRAALSWTYNALTPEQATVFALLGQAPGPDISVAAAECLTQRGDLRALERVSLIQEHVPGRYRAHDLVKLFAADQASPDLVALRRLVDFYLHTAYAAERLIHPERQPIQLEPSRALPLADEAASMAWMDAEHANLLATQRLAVQLGWHTLVWQLAWAMDTYHWRRGQLLEELATWQAGLAAAESLGEAAPQILAHRLLGQCYGRAGQFDDAVRHLHQSLALAEQVDARSGQALAHRQLAWAVEQQGDIERALDHADQALKLFETLDDPAQEAQARNMLGWYHAKLGRHDQARTHCEAALAVARRHDYREGEASTLDSLGYIAMLTGDYPHAVGYLLQALDLYRDRGNTYQEAGTLDRLAQAHQALGQDDRARTTWRQALKLYQAQHRVKDAERVLGSLR